MENITLNCEVIDSLHSILYVIQFVPRLPLGPYRVSTQYLQHTRGVSHSKILCYTSAISISINTF